MTFTVITMALVMGTVVWWLIRQTINIEPWTAEESTLHINNVGFVNESNNNHAPSVKIGLGVFLAVATSLFALFISAYFIRMELSDWRPVEEPIILWANTALLIMGSICLQWAVVSERRGKLNNMKTGLLSGGLFAIAFVLGQLIAWSQLAGSGLYLNSNPASTFFYVLTAMHGIHILGGVFAWGKTLIRSLSMTDHGQVSLGVELCATYWHFLLVIWLILFALLSST
ncbi:MAG: cytochrome c oxidase subunit 3 [Pseudomonadales bacterium]|nr:cytochrome c oxidase subunit 3 [Pseudomonadales bacterium]